MWFLVCSHKMGAALGCGFLPLYFLFPRGNPGVHTVRCTSNRSVHSVACNIDCVPLKYTVYNSVLLRYLSHARRNDVKIQDSITVNWQYVPGLLAGTA